MYLGTLKVMIVIINMNVSKMSDAPRDCGRLGLHDERRSPFGIKMIFTKEGFPGFANK